MSEIKNETSALRYMDADGGIYSGQNAQNFLQNKIRKNAHGRYTQQQIDRLMQSGGPAVVNASDGAIPGGQYYDSQNPTKNQGDGEAAGSGTSYGSLGRPDNWKFDHTNQIEEYGSLTDLGFDDARIQEIRKHAAGLSTSEADGFGFTADTENNWKELDDPTSAGSLQADMRKISKHLGFEHSGSLNQKRVLDYIMEGENKVEKPGVEEEENKPIEHSPEARQAIERVRTYENDVMSGKMSDDIFGGGSYSFDSNKGGAGIGTPQGAQSGIEAKATSAFLDSKKNDVKKAYNFKPAS